MTIDDFRRLALSLPGVEEKSHMGSPDFRVGGRIFATLAAQQKGYGNVMLTPEQQAEFVAEAPQIFIPIAGGWGATGATHVCLAGVDEEMLKGALEAAWRVRREKNAKADRPKKARRKRAKKVGRRARDTPQSTGTAYRKTTVERLPLLLTSLGC